MVQFATNCCFAGMLLLLSVVNGSFILTSPKVIDAGSTVYFTLTVLDVPHGGVVTIQLLLEGEEEPIAESQVTVLSNHNMWVEMFVPALSSDMSARLAIQGSFINGYRIHSATDVRIRHHTILTFIQTDKPLYKPGQTIRFRVLPMDNQLKPLSGETVGDIWIEDPLGRRIDQWKQEKFSEGMKQFELQLSEEPSLGTWKITTVINKVTSFQTFRVEKYVLPKFEVTIKPPDVIMADAQTIEIQICAKYTYGKVVDGTLSAKITYEARHWDSFPIPSVEHMGQISGCHDFFVDTDDLLLQTGNFGYRTLKIFAEVTENGTGIVRNATTHVEITHYPVYIDFIRNNKYYKQKLPYYGYLQVKKPDESPASSEKIQICARFQHDENSKEICRIFTSNKNGMVPFSVAPTTAKKISLKASAINYELLSYSDRRWDVKIGVPHASMDLKPWYSPSDSYLQIETSTDEFECDKLQQVKVRYTAKQGTSIKFYHQVLSKGRIVQQGSHQRTFYSKEQDEMEYDLHEEQYYSGNYKNNLTRLQEIGEFILSFDPRATMSPKARLLIFYVREDREVVADSRMFSIKRCLLNKVDFTFRHEKQYPSTEAAMLLAASPSSLCGISMVDKSVLLLERDSTFNKDRIFKLMENFDVGKETRSPYPHHRTEQDECDVPEIDYFTIDHRMVFGPSGPHYRPHGRSDYVDTVMAFQEAGMVVMTDLKIKTRPCAKRGPLVQPIFMMRADNNMLPGIRGEYAFSLAKTEPEKNNLIPEDRNPPKSTEEIRSYFPETWLWELHSVGLTGETAIKRQLPHTITEWTGGALCIHPKTGLGISDIATITAFQPFFLDYQLPYSAIRGETFTLIVSVFNYLTECLPIKISLEPSEHYKLLSDFRYEKLCVCGGQSSASSFLIRPVTLGDVNITVYGFSIEDDDEICGNEITARLSARDAVTKPLTVEAEGFPKEEVFNYFICPEKTSGSYSADVDMLLPEDVISDSARAYMSVTGDIMGPALNGLKGLVRLPFGCGEQNMVLFTPNIFVMDYLTSTEKMTPDIKGQCLSNMKSGYQRELQYRHADGSYSAFGPRDKEGSLWLTAFVLKSFGQARRFINIDENDLNLSVQWILSMQFENGCFKPSGKVFHKEMKGGLSDGDQSLAPLTAYVLISLMESGTDGFTPIVIENGLSCLESENSLDNYALALFAYANALAKKNAADKFMMELDKRAIVKGNQKYWKSTSTSRSVTVEIAGYYILASLEMGGLDSIENILPVVRWITQQRNSEGGFVSTQDTVVALQALAKYATYQKQDKVDIGLAIESEELVQGFKIDEGNKLLTQSVKIPVVPGVLEIEAVGEGCALMQFSLHYNVEKVPTSDAFDLNVNVRRLGSSDCNLPMLGICMRYKIPNQKSNMAVLAIKMATGFAPDEWSLLLLKNEPSVGLNRYDVTGNEVNLYFDELTNEQKCFKFHMKSEFEVEDLKPSNVHLYDYYQPEMTISKEYTIPSTCNVTALPELPTLPSLHFEHAEEYDASEVEILSSTVDTESVEFTKFSTVPIEEISTSTVEAESVEFTEFSTVPIDTDVGLFEWATEMLPEPLEDKADFLADSVEPVENSNKNSTHFAQFVDVSYELDFPDGLEANVPVSVLPLEYQDELEEYTTKLEALLEAECPKCTDNFPENFSEVYCNSAFALKVDLRDGTQNTIKILQDVSFYMDSPKSVKKFGKLELAEYCVCPQLDGSGTQLFIVGSPLDLWNSKEKKHKILLNGSVYVLALQPKEIQTFITQTKSKCSDDP